jgi:putative ABC transport system permease protein
MGKAALSSLLQEAAQATASNRLRTFLTLLGVIIGVASVILMVSVGETARDAVTRSLEAMGTNIVIVFSGSASTSGVRGASGSLPTLTVADTQELRALPLVRSVSAIVGRTAQVVAGARNSNTTVLGVEESYFGMSDSQIREGEALSSVDVHTAARRVVLGATVCEALFGIDGAIGEELRINRIPYVVVGVLRSKGHNFTGQDEDDVVLMPLTTAQRTLYSTPFAGSVQVIMVEATSRLAVSQVESEISQALRERHRISKDAEDDFTVKSVVGLGETTQSAAHLLSLLLGAIASISLVVGGIGIMNMMLVGVSERTREIGVRLAVGARQRDIGLQFLFESLFIAIIGGLLGAVLALGVVGIARLASPVPIAVSWNSVGLAIGVAGSVGVIFGMYPALRAARLNPVAALRHE